MSITKNKKSNIIKDFGKNGKDSGSPNVQAAILTERIKNLTDPGGNGMKYILQFPPIVDESGAPFINSSPKAHP